MEQVYYYDCDGMRVSTSIERQIEGCTYLGTGGKEGKDGIANNPLGFFKGIPFTDTSEILKALKDFFYDLFKDFKMLMVVIVLLVVIILLNKTFK